MATRDFSKYFLYRWRYVIGYTLVGLLLASLLVFAGLFLPGGLSSQEMASVVRSESLSLQDPSTLAIANMPYYALQAGVVAADGRAGYCPPAVASAGSAARRAPPAPVDVADVPPADGPAPDARSRTECIDG